MARKKRLHRLSIDAPTPLCDSVTGLLALEAPSGWQEEPLEGGTRFMVFFETSAHLAALAEKLRAIPEIRLAAEEVETADPLEAWKDFFTPVVCGKNFVILPPWLAEEDFGHVHKLLIEPKSAFGTGHHATTRLCLSTLDRLYDEGRLSGGKFLDLGCGTGILAFGCAKLGMRGKGVDIDPIAIENANENRELNGISQVEFQTGGADLLGKAENSLILANILAEPLLEMAEAIAAALVPGGMAILSGLLKKQAPNVGQAFARAGLVWDSSASEGEWVALVFFRPVLPEKAGEGARPGQLG